MFESRRPDHFSGIISQGTLMVARIFRPARTAMQSGEARTKEWVLEFDPAEPRSIDPLMGWTSSGDMRN
ncbi:MAG TPA: NADH dehydrogenase ubiquinone Fe-S protein 4, partial [Candidatus Acidoferrales bacterium]|nr:NADH dehydrogenase ubiquinone Fe-S protein 4 [Candidatus Acidoferrales bacterium]